MNESAQRDEMVLLARSMFERGLTPGSSGNLSDDTDQFELRLSPG